MMNSRLIPVLFIAFVAVFSYSCKDKYTATYMANTPIYMDFETFRNQPISMELARDIKQPGKIWIKDQYLFINEVLKGIHVFDNSNPSAPMNLGFIPIHANVDMAVEGNKLYADNYNDLLTIDITDPSHPQLLCRANDVFNFQAVNNIQGYDKNYAAAGVIWEKGVITGWQQEEVTEEVGGVYHYAENDFFAFDSALESSTNPSGISSVSIGGSMARFTLQASHLHILEERSLTTFDVSSNCPEQTNLETFWRVGETIFHANDHLFVGTTTGMMIYDATNPEAPSLLSEYPHVASCDPVVVSGDKAYVTLRTNNRCQGDINELVIIDISDLANPTEIVTYDMTNPHGLGLDNNTLFLCDGSDGLKIFDVTNSHTVEDNLIGHFENIQTFDVIPFNGKLLMSASEGIFQYDYSNLDNITQLSLIPVQ